MGVGSSKGEGGVGSSKSAGSKSSGTGTIENRQVTRKAKKEDLFTIATYSILPGGSLLRSSVRAVWSTSCVIARTAGPQPPL